jgi:hypothetical protein
MAGLEIPLRARIRQLIVKAELPARLVVVARVEQLAGVVGRHTECRPGLLLSNIAVDLSHPYKIIQDEQVQQ